MEISRGKNFLGIFRTHCFTKTTLERMFLVNANPRCIIFAIFNIIHLKEFLVSVSTKLKKHSRSLVRTFKFVNFIWTLKQKFHKDALWYFFFSGGIHRFYRIFFHFLVSCSCFSFKYSIRTSMYLVFAFFVNYTWKVCRLFLLNVWFACFKLHFMISF